MTAGSDRVGVLYVGSWSRSGSTLLDLMLGQVPGFRSTGELRYLWERGVAAGQRCGCGAAVPVCPFWSAVLEEAFGRPGHLDAAGVLAVWRRVDHPSRLPLLLGPWRPASLERDLRALREVLVPLYRAVRTVSGARVVVDSSKYASYAAILAGMPELDLRLLHLVRDSRAVAYSWTRRKPAPDHDGEPQSLPRKPPWRSAVWWSVENLALHLVRRVVRRHALVRYEALAADPWGAIETALRAIGLPAELEIRGEARLRMVGNHLVAGNPLRFRRGEVPIRPDEEWRHGLDPAAARVVTVLTLSLLLRYGYPVRVR